MKRLSAVLLSIVFCASFAVASTPSVVSDGLVWHDWSENLFQTARKENKLVILDLEAVWCHWCHVMEDTTYADPAVKAILKKNYIPVRVDQDAHPDLSVRYEEYGWPATVIFASDGTELVKRRGYIDPAAMASLLQAVVDDPTPGPSIVAQPEIRPAESPFLTADQRVKLDAEHEELWDEPNGGWGSIYKLIDANHLEVAMARALAGDLKEEARAKRVLDLALNLEDPVWGGFYQYSDRADWKSPHYEKIMLIQAQYMRAYALAYAAWGKSEYLDAARRTAAYVKRFWTSPEGGFYTSQDADADGMHGDAFYALDDAGRRAAAGPPIDKHRYARENGWMIASLASLYDVTGDRATLDAAVTALEWVVENRTLPGGGFRHDETDRAGPYLGDTLAMGQAYLALYVSTADAAGLEGARAAFDFIEKNFRAPEAGYATAKTAASGPLGRPVFQIEENVSFARFANLLFHYTGDARARDAAAHAMRHLASPALIDSRRFLGGVLVADAELASDPVHITVVGSKDDPAAQALHAAARRYPVTYRRIEWWDRSQGPLPNPDVAYPELDQAAAFGCAFGACSTPVFDPENLAPTIDRFKNRVR